MPRILANNDALRALADLCEALAEFSKHIFERLTFVEGAVEPAHMLDRGGQHKRMQAYDQMMRQFGLHVVALADVVASSKLLRDWLEYHKLGACTLDELVEKLTTRAATADFCESRAIEYSGVFLVLRICTTDLYRYLRGLESRLKQRKDTLEDVADNGVELSEVATLDVAVAAIAAAEGKPIVSIKRNRNRYRQARKDLKGFLVHVTRKMYRIRLREFSPEERRIIKDVIAKG